MPRTEIERLRAAMELAVASGGLSHVRANATAIAGYLMASYSGAGLSVADIRAELIGLALEARPRRALDDVERHSA